MLSLLPEILFLSPFAATIIRIALAILLAHEAWHSMAHSDMQRRVLAFVKVLVAVGLFLGAWTQMAALGATLILALSLALPHLRVSPLSTTLLALIMAISLILTGAGAFAFDLPL